MDPPPPPIPIYPLKPSPHRGRVLCVLAVAVLSLQALTVIVWHLHFIRLFWKHSRLRPQLKQRRPPDWIYSSTYVHPAYPPNHTAPQHPDLSEHAASQRDLHLALARLRQVHADADEEQQAFDFASVRSIQPKSGFTVDIASPTSTAAQYQCIDEPQNPIWLNAASRVPFCARNASRPVYVDVVRNAYYSKHGVSYNARTETVYDLGGGCCVEDWDWHVGDRIDIYRNATTSFKNSRNATVLVLAQHHGDTYHHALFEVLPRYLSVLPFVEAVPEMRVVIEDSDVVENLLWLLGLDPQRIVRAGRDYPLQFARILLYPPAKYQDTFTQIYYGMDCVERAVAVLLKSITLSLDQDMYEKAVRVLGRIPYPDTQGADLEGALAGIEDEISHGADRRPSIVILKRTFYQPLRTRECNIIRCMRNFRHLHDEIESRFGSKYDIEVYQPRATTAEAAVIFDRASIVVGMHGGGFQNLMFCRPGTDVVHIGWGYNYKNTADNFGLRYHLFRIAHINLHSKNITVDVKEISDVVQKIVERRNGV